MLPRTILVPIDFSTCSERALDYALSLAERLDATVHLVTAIAAAMPGLDSLLSAQTDAAPRLEAIGALQKLATERSSLAKIGRLIALPGDARDAILQIANELHIDLIVMGTHGRRGVSRLVLGSVAEEIVRRAPCAVLTVRQEKGSSHG